MQTILYCHRESSHSYKVALALTPAGVPFEQRAVDLNLPRARRPDDFRRASMSGEVPALVDEDGLAVCQSNATTIADTSCCGHLFWADRAEVDLAPWPAVTAWLDRIRSLPRSQAPYDLLEDRFPIRPGTRT